MLRLIGANPGIRQGHLAETLAIKPAHITKLVRRMIEKGHVRRVVAAGDRRAVDLYHTETGADFVARPAPRVAGPASHLRHDLTQDEPAHLTRLLPKFAGIGDVRGLT